MGERRTTGLEAFLRAEVGFQTEFVALGALESALRVAIPTARRLQHNASASSSIAEGKDACLTELHAGSCCWHSGLCIRDYNARG